MPGRSPATLRISDGSGIRFFVVSGTLFIDGSMRYDASEQSNGNAPDSGFKIIPICPYVQAQYKRHPEWADVMAPLPGAGGN
jgi:GCN5-related N-acetyltransferase